MVGLKGGWAVDTGFLGEGFLGEVAGSSWVLRSFQRG